MKGQAAVDYFTIISVSLLILVPIVAYLNQLLTAYSDDNNISLAKNTVNKLGETADWVFSQGPPAKNTFMIYIPAGIEDISFSNKMILFRVKTSAGTTDVYYQTVAVLDGYIPKKSGYYHISLIAFDDYVNITVV
jgi:hypothetical protein